MEDGSERPEGQLELLERTQREIAHLIGAVAGKQRQCEDLQTETEYFKEYAGSMMESGVLGGKSKAIN